MVSSATPARLEIRKLKYELFTDADHRKFFPTNTPTIPSHAVYDAIFKDQRILPLCRFIASTADFYGDRVGELNNDANQILQYIDANFKAIDQ